MCVVCVCVCAVQCVCGAGVCVCAYLGVLDRQGKLIRKDKLV